MNPLLHQYIPTIPLIFLIALLPRHEAPSTPIYPYNIFNIPNPHISHA